MTLSWGHCPCGVAIARDRAFCPRCEEKSLVLVAAIAQQDRRDQRMRESRYRMAFLLRLLALVWFSAVVGPTCEHGTLTRTFQAAGIGLIVLLLASLIAPKRKHR